MEHYKKMKWIKSFVFYGFMIHLFTYIYDTHTLSSLLFHYPELNFGYLIFVLVQIFWTSQLFSILYHYITLATFIHIRISHRVILFQIIKELCFHCLFYVLTNIFFLMMMNQSLSYFLLYKNLVIQIISFLCVVFIRNNDYSYIMLVCFILALHILL